MEDFLTQLDKIKVPRAYEKVMLDALDSVIKDDNKNIECITAEERDCLGYIIAWDYYNSKKGNKKNKNMPFGGTSVTKGGLGFRINLKDLPPHVVHRLCAYIFSIVN